MTSDPFRIALLGHGTVGAAFARLLEEYDRINDQVAGAESRQAPMSDEAETDLRKRRARLKDEIARALAGG